MTRKINKICEYDLKNFVISVTCIVSFSFFSSNVIRRCTLSALLFILLLFLCSFTIYIFLHTYIFSMFVVRSSTAGKWNVCEESILRKLSQYNT